MPNSSRVRLLALFLISLAPFAQAAPARLDLLVNKDAVYRVSFESLAEHGLTPQPTSVMSLSNAGQPVPMWVEHSDGGEFGPGSSLIFVGQHRRGPHSHHDEHARHNVYRLRFEGEPALLGKDLVATIPTPDAEPALITRHLEEDRVRVRFNPGRVEPEAEIWYWRRLSVLDKEPLELPIDLGKITSHADAKLRLRISLRGWSFTHRPGDVPDHQVEVLWNGEKIAAPEWNGQAEHELSLDNVPAALLRDGLNSLQIRVPLRRDPKTDSTVVDVSLLNWVKIEHVFDGHLENGQIGLRIPDSGAVRFAPEKDETPSVALYSMNGERVEFPRAPKIAAAAFSAPEPEVLLLVGPPQTAVQIRRDQPSKLRNTDQQADYLMIAHGSLLEATRPLAEFHRSRGMNVALIDVQDIFDEFNDGVLSPNAIRDFTSHAYHAWSKPAPRFVLLVGDASWDMHGEGMDDSNYADWTFQNREATIGRFVKNSSTAYSDPNKSRNLIPTLQVETPEGNSASDSELVAVDGDDWKPDMAIGRIPVADSEEVGSIVRKLIDYETLAPVGPWRRSALWIANEEAYMQLFTNKVATNANQHGMLPVKVFAETSTAGNNNLYQRQLIDGFDTGQLLVHFVGHGGRYIWRTGPPDPRTNHDLFTLDHIDQLAPTSRLPVVLSMTCYSAPFDHPTADSIGEKFLRAENRGAVGVLAASWRNTPQQSFSDAVVQNLLKGQQTVGEAILEAKRVTTDRILVQTYNYLGDPATRLSLPSVELPAQLLADSKQITISIDLDAVPQLREGRVMFDSFDAEGNLLASSEQALGEKPFVISRTGPDGVGLVASVSVYAWHEARRVDAITHIGVPGDVAVALEGQP